MRKPVTAVLDRLRHRITQFVMNQGRARTAATEVGIRRPGLKDGDDWHDQYQTYDNPAPSRTPSAHKRLVASCDGAVVARSQILVSGSTATLLGTLTNETGRYVYFSGMPPYAITFDPDGRGTLLSGDFHSPPREQPSSGDCVMHPGASVPYRSLPVTLQNRRPRWDGTDWCVYSCCTTLDKTFYSERGVPTIQLFV